MRLNLNENYLHNNNNNTFRIDTDNGSETVITNRIKNVTKIVKDCCTSTISMKELTQKSCESLFDGTKKKFKNIEVKVIFCVYKFCIIKFVYSLQKF